MQQRVVAIERSLIGTTKKSNKSVFEKSVRPAVVVGIVLAVFQQVCGINVVFNYTSTIFESIGANLDKQLFETVAIGIVNLIFTLLAMWQVDKLGRRPLMLAGFLGLSILYIILALLLQNHFSESLVSIFVLMAISTYAMSLAPLHGYLFLRSSVIESVVQHRLSRLYHFGGPTLYWFSLFPS